MFRTQLLGLLQSSAEASSGPATRFFAKLSDVHANTLVGRTLPRTYLRSKPVVAAGQPSTPSASSPQTVPAESTSSTSTSTRPPTGLSAWLPWRRELTFWQKFYWGVGGAALAFIAYQRWKNRETEEMRLEREQRERELAEKRKDFLRAVMAGRSFLEGDDPFKGMPPKQIQEFVEEHKGELMITSDDPFEGLTPEEIDEYVAKHGMQAS